jgi:hypothetical protein
MTFAEKFEAEIRKHFHIAGVRVHHQEKIAYKESPTPILRRPKTKRQVVGAPRPGTLRHRIAELLKAAPEGLTSPELRKDMPANVTSSVIAGMIWTMDQEYREIEPSGSRVVGHKHCRVYKWIAQ